MTDAEGVVSEALAPAPSEPVTQEVSQPVPTPAETPTEVPVAEVEESPAAEPPAPPAQESTPPPPPVQQTPTTPSIKSRLSEAFAALTGRKRTRLDKIIALAQKKHSIKNDDVEKLLRVSDSTAQRYLNQLVLEGKLKRSGSTKSIIYEPV